MARTPPEISTDSISVGGRTVDLNSLPSGAEYFTLRGDIRVSAVRHSPVYKNDSSEGAYQVPANHELEVFAVYVKDTNFSTGMQSTIGYGDTAVAQDDVSPPTNAKWRAGDGNPLYRGGDAGNDAATSGGHQAVAEKFIIPAGKYPFYQGNQGANHNCVLHCILRPV